MARKGYGVNYQDGASGIIGLIVLGICGTVSANSGYLVVMPSVFRPRVQEVLSVTLLKPTEPIYVEAKLFSNKGQLIAEGGHEIFGKGTVKLKVPSNAEGLCTLKICGNCNAIREGSYAFYNSTIVKVEEKGTSVFLQTDKPIYKPSQTVQINVILTYPDLRPVNTKMVLSVLDPHQSQIMKWTDLEPLCCGVINVSFPLSEQPLLGTWSIEAKVQGHTYSRKFEIQKYVLSKFEVTIQAPHYIKDWTKCEKVFVHARYTFGQSVKGMVKLQYSIRGIGYYSDHFSSVLTHHSKLYGTAAFNVCISDAILQHNIPDHFRGQLHLLAEVTTPDGTTVEASDESCPVNKQLVDLQFSRDTRKNFKPGLPFKGRVLVQHPDGSSADNVSILVESNVDGIHFSRETFVTKNGEVQFYIPPLPVVAQSMALNAKILSIGDGKVPDYYFEAYQTIYSWYSPSKCHLLIDSRSSTYKVGEEGRFMIHSTCPCNLDMYYEVKSRGNLVHSGIHFSRHEHKHSPAATAGSKFTAFLQKQENETFGSKTCAVFIKFLITHEMAPFSRLLMYYVRPNGEGVADSILFNVEPDFRNHMSMELSDQQAMPGEDLKLRIETRPGSCVCIGAVDKSVHLLKPGYLLSKDEIFSELESYDVSTEVDGASQYRMHEHHRTKRSWQPLDQAMPIRDAKYAFEECGLLVMTDTVNLHFRQEEQVNIAGPSYAYELAELIASQKEVINKKRSRVYFPETWIWKCFNTSATRKETPLVVRVPDSITTWVFSGFSMNHRHGLALSPKTNLKTFQYFFLDMTLPYSVIRGEQVKIPLIVHNYLHACVRVHLEMLIPNTLEVISNKDSIKKFCIGTEETKTIFYDMVFKKLGQQKVSAEAEAYADSRCCSGILSDQNPNKQYLTGTDAIKRKILVEPDGISRFYTHSVYFCPNSRIQLSTPNRYEFQYIARPSDMVSFTFSVKAQNDARVALSPGPKDNNELVEIVLGGAFNQESWINVARTAEMVANASTIGILSDEEFRNFWISWGDNMVKVGHGSDVFDNTTEFLIYESDRPLFVEYIGFSTGWGSEGEFQIWKKRELSGSGYGEVMHLGLPGNTIPGSSFASVKLSGDLMGPSIHHLDKLLRLPQGCGEQNMANFAPNVYILEYLEKTNQLNNDIKLRVVKLLTKGYQRQMTYGRRDGSFSAFGVRDATGNTWLTAFVMKTFAQAKPYIFIDEDDLDRSKKWIMDRQRVDGSFEAVGRLINKEIQGGLPGRLSLTAYILTALYHAGINSKMERMVVRMAQNYLENNAHLIQDPYTAAISAYALCLFKSDRSYTVLKTLSQMAIKNDGMVYWKLYNYEVQEFLLFHDESIRGRVSSAEIEIAGYAAMAYLTKDDVSSAFPIIKWLTAQRNSFGGFSSTQDTVVALQALSIYAIQSYSEHLDMTVSLASTNMDLQERFELNPNNSDVIQMAVVPSLPAGLFLSAVGEGCAMLQVEVQYNVPDPSKSPAFEIRYQFAQQRKVLGVLGHRHSHRPEVRLTMETCTKWLHLGSTNMAVIEVSILTGYTPDIKTLDKLLSDKNLKLKRYDVDGRKIIFYFDEIFSRCVTCLQFEMVRKYKVEDVQPVPIRIYDYYEPSYSTEVLYGTTNIQQLSPNANTTGYCNSVFGCSKLFPSPDILCSCYQDCQNIGPEVCASDGSTYKSQCHMEIEACLNDQHLEVLPQQACEYVPVDGSGDLLDAEVTLYSWFNNGTSNTVTQNEITTVMTPSNITSPKTLQETSPYETFASNLTELSKVEHIIQLQNSTVQLLNSTVQSVFEGMDTTFSNYSTNYTINKETTDYPHNTNNGSTMVEKTTNQSRNPDLSYDTITEGMEMVDNETSEDMADFIPTTEAYSSQRLNFKKNPANHELKYEAAPDLHLIMENEHHRDKLANKLDKTIGSKTPLQLLNSTEVVPESSQENATIQDNADNETHVEYHDNVVDFSNNKDSLDFWDTLSEYESSENTIGLDPHLLDEYETGDYYTASDLSDKEFMDLIASYYDFSNMDIPEKSTKIINDENEPPSKTSEIGISKNDSTISSKGDDPMLLNPDFETELANVASELSNEEFIALMSSFHNFSIKDSQEQITKRPETENTFDFNLNDTINATKPQPTISLNLDKDLTEAITTESSIRTEVDVSVSKDSMKPSIFNEQLTQYVSPPAEGAIELDTGQEETYTTSRAEYITGLFGETFTESDELKVSQKDEMVNIPLLENVEATTKDKEG